MKNICSNIGIGLLFLIAFPLVIALGAIMYMVLMVLGTIRAIKRNTNAFDEIVGIHQSIVNLE